MDIDASSEEQPYRVGYKRPPLHTRFRAGQSGNPSGRRKGSLNLKTLFDQILREEVSLREGSSVRKVSKAEAVLRGLVIGALKGDSRSLAAMFRLAEQTGQFEEATPTVTEMTIRRIIVDPKSIPPGGDYEPEAYGMDGESKVAKDEEPQGS